MAFDITTAKPVQSSGFDISTARPVEDEPATDPSTFNHDDYYKQMNEQLGPVDAFMVGAGRGMNTIGRGLGLVDQEAPIVRGAAEDLSENSMAVTAGEIIGEAAPFMLAAPVGGAGLSVGSKVLIPAAKSLLTRVGLSATIGAAEGGAIARGQGGGATETAIGAGVGGTLAGAVEALIPVLGRFGGAIFRRLKRRPKGPLLTRSGEPTEELMVALNDVGMTFDDLTDDAVEYIVNNQKSITNPAEAARKARFDSLDIPYTKGDISQDFTQQAAETRLSSMAVEEGEPLRQLKLQQSEALTSRIDELVERLGVPSRTGDSVKEALSGRKTLLGKQKNKLYRELAEKAPEVMDIPILPNVISDSLPDKATFRRLERLSGSQVKAVRELLVEFGIDKSDEAIEEFGGEITPLTLGNLEDFRSALNMIDRADPTGAASVAIGPIRQALDAESDLLDKALTESGREGVMQIAKKARSTVRQMKTEFSPQAITGRLIDVKRDGVTPVVEASKVFRELSTKPVEQLERTIRSLAKSGDKGKQAIGDMRASVVLGALEDALKAPSRKTSGIETIGGNQFYKSLKKFGEDRLEILFRGDPGASAQLKNLQQAALDTMPAAATTPKGSAPVILDMARKLGRAPIVAGVIDLTKLVFTAGADDRAVSKAIRAKPDLMRTVGLLQAEFPALAAAIGVSTINIEEQEQ